MKNFFSRHRTFFSVFWLLFTVSLGIWWFWLALDNTQQLIELTRQLGGTEMTARLESFARQRNMIRQEGLIFLLFLCSGGGVLIWLVHRDNKRHRLLQDFFSTLTHEMKTPLTSLQLQVESLLEEHPRGAIHSSLQKILNENARIERQMNKAFYLASLMRSEGLYIEHVDLYTLLSNLAFDWPQLEIAFQPGVLVKVDQKAFESILKNIFENAVQHGQATQIRVGAASDLRHVTLEIIDNGHGFQGDFTRLGQAFVRHSQSSGSGIGIYIIRSLINKMQGQVEFSNAPDSGMLVRIQLPPGDPKQTRRGL